MIIVAVVPARGGSKGVVGKNVARVGGVPLVERAVRSIGATGLTDYIYVSTDDDEIASSAASAGAKIISRPSLLATDESSSEDALIHACSDIELQLGITPDVLVFVQATSPFVDIRALGEAIDGVAKGEADSIFSAMETYEFIWTLRGKAAHGVNHDERRRLRRQDREPQFRETGAFYVMNWTGFMRAKHRFFGRTGVAVVDPATSIEIDSYAELEIARALAHLHPVPSGTKSRRVAALVTDFDGVHTDDHAWLSQDGSESVRVSRSDGLGVDELRRVGIPMLILSKESNPVVSRRAEKLGVECLQGVDDKAEAITSWSLENGIDLAEIMYVGNDINDIPAMRLVGLPVVVADASPAARAEALIILDHCGGTGAVREAVHILLDSRKV